MCIRDRRTRGHVTSARRSDVFLNGCESTREGASIRRRVAARSREAGDEIRTMMQRRGAAARLPRVHHWRSAWRQQRELLLRSASAHSTACRHDRRWHRGTARALACNRRRAHEAAPRVPWRCARRALPRPSSRQRARRERCCSHLRLPPPSRVATATPLARPSHSRGSSTRIHVSPAEAAATVEWQRRPGGRGPTCGEF